MIHSKFMKVSVIIPAYNAQKTIGQCIEALLVQNIRAKTMR
jgi:glycosyltransferase involved in cell wall biosynthesis